MRRLMKILGVLLVTVMLVSCVATPPQPRSRPMPPGHAKKVYGGGQARHYAPGHMKKKVHYKNHPGKGHKKHKPHHQGRH